MDARLSSDLLYHYTDNRGLVGILTSGELWFSDIRFLNDARELDVARDIIAHNIWKVANQHRGKWIEDECASEQYEIMVKNIISTVCANWHRWSKIPEPNTTPFIFSMTTNPDSLSQWRAYGEGEYCIAFHASRLLEIIEGAELVKVAYVKNPEDIKFGVYGMNDFFINHLAHIDKSSGMIHPEVLHDGASEFFHRHHGSLYDRRFLVKYKDFGFHEEDERRLLLHIDPSTDDRVIFSANGPYRRPRVRVRIFEPGDGFSVVNEIKVGPGLNQELARAALDVLFASTHCDGIKVSASTIPYRT